MRVLLLYKDYYPIVGGIENHMRLLAQGLRTEGIDARVLVTNTGPATLHETIDGVPVTKTGRQAHILSTPISLPFFVELRRQAASADLVHLHAPYPPAELAQLLLGRGKPAVITYHSDIVRQRRTGKIYAPLLRKVLQRAALVAASSPVYIESSPFLRRLREKCRVIHYGIELDRFIHVSSQVQADRAKSARPLPGQAAAPLHRPSAPLQRSRCIDPCHAPCQGPPPDCRVRFPCRKRGRAWRGQKASTKKYHFSVNVLKERVWPRVMPPNSLCCPPPTAPKPWALCNSKPWPAACL